MTDASCCGPGYASPAEAMRAPREKLLYSIAIYTGTGIQKPDYLVYVANFIMWRRKRVANVVAAILSTGGT